MQVLQNNKMSKLNIFMSNILLFPNLTLAGFEEEKNIWSEISDDVDALGSKISEMEIVFSPISVSFRWSWE